MRHSARYPLGDPPNFESRPVARKGSGTRLYCKVESRVGFRYIIPPPPHSYASSQTSSHHLT